jgi:outer membrane protein OmpA-like peptidoglycan-associated protein
MSPARLLVFPVIAAAVVAAGCGPKRQPALAAIPPAPPALILLLPDPETRITGRARVSNEFGSADLSTARAASLVTSSGAPAAVTTVSEEEVTRLFGAALAALPPAPQHFTLQFRFESDTLTEQSVAVIPAILRAVKTLAVPEVVVIGHTDTMGDAKSNLTLGLKRAATVRGILVGAGLPASTVEIVSHGEGDLLVKTRNNVPEPRNRRVDITVR